MGARLVGSMFIERDGDIVEEFAAENLEALVETKPYVLVDARINKRITTLGLDLYVAAQNLTNTVQPREEWDIADAAMVYAPIYGTTVTAGFKKGF